MSETIFRVPMMGGRIIHRMRSAPPDNPGIAAIQYSWSLLNAKPIALSLPTRALGRNHAMKHMVRANVVIDSVRQASPLFQLASSLGFQGLQRHCRRCGGRVCVGGHARTPVSVGAGGGGSRDAGVRHFHEVVQVARSALVHAQDRPVHPATSAARVNRNRIANAVDQTPVASCA